MDRIRALFNVVDRSLFYKSPSLNYGRLTEAIIKLADTIMDLDTDENIWYIGEGGMCSLDDLIIGAYWHYTEWASDTDDGYAALCALGQVYMPNMEMPDEDNAAYRALAKMAK